MTARHRSCADSMSLNAMARPAVREPGPLVILVRCLTVAKVDSIGLVVRRYTPVLARVVVERQQLVRVVGDLRGGLGELRAVGGPESLHRGEGVRLVLQGSGVFRGCPVLPGM